MLNIFLKWSTCIVRTPFLLGDWVSYQIFKKAAWQDLNFWRDVDGKEGGDFFQQEGEGLQFLNKK